MSESFAHLARRSFWQPSHWLDYCASMDLDDSICLCFHVSWRKVIQYIRVEKPRVVSQLSECGGAGTGCGWCRHQLKQLMEQQCSSASSNSASSMEDWRELSADQYRQQRSTFRQNRQ